MSEPVRERDYEHVPEVGTVTAVFSATARRGEWLPPEELRVRALFGAVQLDFRKALLAPGETTLEVLALFGAVEILVPHDLEVEVAASAVLGSVEQRDHGGGMKGFIAEQIRRATGQVPERRELRPADEEPPLLRVEGRAVFGSIIVRRR